MYTKCWCWILGTWVPRYWMLDAGCWVLGARCWALGAEYGHSVCTCTEQVPRYLLRYVKP